MWKLDKNGRIRIKGQNWKIAKLEIGQNWKSDKIENSLKLTKFDKNDGIRTPKQRQNWTLDKIENSTKLIKFDKNDKIGRNRQNWTKFDLALHHNAKSPW